MRNRSLALEVCFAGLLAASCATTRFTPTGEKLAPHDRWCKFDLLTAMPERGYQEIGVIDVGAYDVTGNIDVFKRHIADEVCAAGGDAAIAFVNGGGEYMKATVLHHMATEAVEPTDDAALDKPTSGLTETHDPSGVLVLRAQVRFQDFSIYVNATPSKDNGRAFVGLRMRYQVPDRQSCALRMMANGRLLELAPSKYRLVGESQELRSSISYNELAALAGSARALGRLCDDEFRFEAEQLAVLRELVLRIHEEINWHEPAPADGGTEKGRGTQWL